VEKVRSADGTSIAYEKSGAGDSRIVILPGQQHIAMETAPDLLVREVSAFLPGPGMYEQRK
jgi:hypothetical protein